MGEESEYLRLRAKLYRLSASPFYAESTPVYLAELKKYLPVFKSLGEERGVGELKDAAEALEGILKDVTERVIDAHERIFARLFLSVSPDVGEERSISPMESPYLSESGLLMQEPRDEIIELFVREKAGPDKELFREPEDHIAAEFHFMALLSVRLAEALERGGKDDTVRSNLETQRELMDKHISRWVPVMTGDVIRETNIIREKEAGEYFKAIALLTRGFVSADKSYLNELAASG